MTGLVRAQTFIEEYFVSEGLCQKLIDVFEERTDLQFSGRLGMGDVDNSRKASTDATLEDFDEYFHLYFAEVTPFFRDYVAKYNLPPEQYPMVFSEPTNIQRYFPNEGYFVEHHERSGANLGLISRELVFMTYLNTIDDFSENQGATVFPAQNMFVRPVMGKTLIWPAGYTHPHYGVTHKSETKYIVTGWKHLILQG